MIDQLEVLIVLKNQEREWLRNSYKVSHEKKTTH